MAARYLAGKCERRDLNPHGFPHWILSPARLPIPPLSQVIYCKAFTTIRTEPNTTIRRVPCPYAWHVNLNGRPMRLASKAEGEEAAYTQYDKLMAGRQPVADDSPVVGWLSQAME